MKDPPYTINALYAAFLFWPSISFPPRSAVIRILLPRTASRNTVWHMSYVQKIAINYMIFGFISHMRTANGQASLC